VVNTSNSKSSKSTSNNSKQDVAIDSIIDIGNTKRIPTSLLQFDKENPRLMTGDEHSVVDDVSIISSYREIAALDELITSICSNGYIDLEPLIVIGKNSGPFTVLEGNRRLAAIKLIGNRKLAEACKVSLPKDIPASVIKSIKEVSVHRVAKATDAEAFIGFKHINGPHRWDAYAKARFVAAWYKRDRASGLTIDSIARQTGDTNNTIRAYIGSIFVLDQAEQEDLFEISNRFNKTRFAFSHLYTALGRKEYSSFLGLEKGWDAEPSDKPVPKKNIKKLQETLEYLYGSRVDNKKPLIESQNPDLKHLGECLVNTTALTRIRSGDALNVAYAEIDGPRLYGEALILANAKLERVIELLPKFDGDKSLLIVADDLLTRAETIATMMAKIAHKIKR
jgi:ParB-like chromosome segregation protein Spo0J